jgi:hypothetical protein
MLCGPNSIGGSVSAPLALVYLSVSWTCPFCGLLRYLVVLVVTGRSLIGPGYSVRRGLLRISGNANGTEHAEIDQVLKLQEDI